MSSTFKVLAATLITVSLLFAQDKPGRETDVTRATLDNGLRVVIVRDPLAPVVTVEQNYLVGGNETPDGFPGMAHAQEHMAFRGCSALSADQISAIFAQLGGFGNADTQQNITQYFTTVPAADLDIALRVDADCMRDIQDAQSEWAQEKPAIEQEVARDLSNPTYKFMTRLNEDMFSGTVYSHDALGTKDSFDATTGEMLKDFYKNWYAPNNAILVIAGDVDPSCGPGEGQGVLRKHPKKSLPPRPEINLQPVKPESFTLDSNLSYLLAFVAFRMPGTDSPDFAAAQILGDVLSSQRGNLYAMVPQGKALQTEFGFAEAYTKASVAYSAAVLPADGNAAPVIAEMRKILADYAANGVPAELVEAAKRREIAGEEFRRNSIPGLAAEWSDALAAEGRNSPDDDVEAMKRVTAGRCESGCQAISRRPKLDLGGIETVPIRRGRGFQGIWGRRTIDVGAHEAGGLAFVGRLSAAHGRVARAPPPSADMTLPNGMRLIVRTLKITPTITVLGSIRHEPQLETAPGKDGVSDVLDDLFSYGTKNSGQAGISEGSRRYCG